jgi:preprotein translocase subunit SecY
MLPKFDRAFWPRLAVTAGVLAAYRLGCHLPLPGLDAKALWQLAVPGLGAIERISVVALNVMPLLNALILVEVLKLAAPGLRRWEAAASRNRRRLGNAVVGIALLTAVFQGYGYTIALEQVSNLVTEPGTWFRVTIIATLVAGTALTIAFVNVIDRAGLGSGLWLVFLTAGLAELPRMLASIASLFGQGVYGIEQVLLTGVFSLLALAAVVSLVLAARAAPATASTCVWAPMVAVALVTPVLFVLGALPSLSLDGGLAFSSPDGIAWYVALAAILALVVWLSVRSWEQAGFASPVPAAPIAASLGAVLIGSLLLPKLLGVLLPLNGTQLIVTATVATTLLLTYGRFDQAAPADEEDAISPLA